MKFRLNQPKINSVSGFSGGLTSDFPTRQMPAHLSLSLSPVNVQIFFHLSRDDPPLSADLLPIRMLQKFQLETFKLKRRLSMPPDHHLEKGVVDIV